MLQRSNPGRRRRLAATGLAVGLALLGLTFASARAQGGLPDIDVVLALEVRDVEAWLTLFDEVLGTAKEAPKPVRLSVNAATGGRRSITVRQPTFMSEIYLSGGARGLRVVVVGKVAGTEALADLSSFKQAVLAAQAGAVENEAILSYGLAGVGALLLELHVSRPVGRVPAA
jgi:hypothetical protein